jgi:hypothetical protein
MTRGRLISAIYESVPATSCQKQLHRHSTRHMDRVHLPEGQGAAAGALRRFNQRKGGHYV